MQVEGEAGLVLQQVLDLDAMKQSGIGISIRDISPLEAHGLVILHEERERCRNNQQASQEMSEAGARIRANSRTF